MDTEENAGGTPVTTSFHLPSYFRDFVRDYDCPSLLLERGVHKPSSAESLAPFHQDQTQRIAMLSIPHPSGHLVFPVEALLTVAKSCAGCDIGWDEWNIHVVIASISEQDLVELCVSGCRLFFISSAHGPDAEVEMYDFSMQGRAKYLSDKVNLGLGGVGYLASTGTKALRSWHVDELYDMRGGHDSVVFLHVSPLLFSCTMRLSGSFVQLPNNPTEDDPNGEGGVLTTWSF